VNLIQAVFEFEEDLTMVSCGRTSSLL